MVPVKAEVVVVPELMVPVLETTLVPMTLGMGMEMVATEMAVLRCMDHLAEVTVKYSLLSRQPQCA